MDVPCVEGMSLLRCPCVPPLGVRRVSAAAHMCAAADDPCSFRKCHCEERSDVGIRYPHTARGVAGVGRVVQRPTPTDAWQNGATHGEYGLPHQCAHRFAMTGFRGVWCVSAGGAFGKGIAFRRERPRSRSSGVFLHDSDQVRGEPVSIRRTSRSRRRYSADRPAPGS